MPTFKIQFRRDVKAQWETVDPVLRDGEIGVEKSDDPSVVAYKIGDGETLWSELPYASGPQGPQGATGDKGDTGATGAQGPAGAQGIQGPQGVAGPQGPAGSQGPQGATGPQGTSGGVGAKGAKGDPGKDFRVAKIYASVDELEEETGDDLEAGDWAIVVTDDYTDEEHGQVYVWNGEAYDFLFALVPLPASGDYAPLASPAFTGEPTAPTPASTDNSTKLSTTAFVKTALSGISGFTPTAFVSASINNPNYGGAYTFTFTRANGGTFAINTGAVANCDCHC
jgi:hypothetical protein